MKIVCDWFWRHEELIVEAAKLLLANLSFLCRKVSYSNRPKRGPADRTDFAGDHNYCDRLFEKKECAIDFQRLPVDAQRIVLSG
jgi:hypothetical protein